MDGDAADVPERDTSEDSGQHETVVERSGAPWGLAAFLVGVLLLVIFVVQNVQEVALRFLGWEGVYPLSLIIIIVIAMTVLLDEILGGVLRRRRRKRHAEKAELRRLRRSQ
jgi:uncharacterized integral membrane protein